MLIQLYPTRQTVENSHRPCVLFQLGNLWLSQILGFIKGLQQYIQNLEII